MNESGINIVLVDDDVHCHDIIRDMFYDNISLNLTCFKESGAFKNAAADKFNGLFRYIHSKG